MDLGEVGWGNADWIGLAQDRNRWRALVNWLLNLRVPWNAGKLSSGLRSSGLSSSAQLHRVSYLDCVRTLWTNCSTFSYTVEEYIPQKRWHTYQTTRCHNPKKRSQGHTLPRKRFEPGTFSNSMRLRVALEQRRIIGQVDKLPWIIMKQFQRKATVSSGLKVVATANIRVLPPVLDTAHPGPRQNRHVATPR
jgi:hypothetical protein